MLDWLAELGEEERALTIRAAFAQVASTQEGEVVFATLFEQLYFFRPCPDEAAVALSNFAKSRLLAYFGDDVQLKVMEAIIGNAKHANLKPPEKEKEDGERTG